LLFLSYTIALGKSNAIFDCFDPSSLIMPLSTNGLLENWKCLLACTLVSMSPFQYGIDFGAIGGLQAMPGFLQVRHNLPTTTAPY
jgi:hypothetical protein